MLPHILHILIFYRKLPTYNPQFTQGKPLSKKIVSSCSKNYRDGYDERSEYVNPDGKRYPRDFLHVNYPKSLWGTGEKFHPNEKPVDLLEYLIRTYTNEGEVVLDATIGSGTTAVACVNTGRQFIGFETDEKYFEIAQKRISDAQAKREQILLE